MLPQPVEQGEQTPSPLVTTPEQLAFWVKLLDHPQASRVVALDTEASDKDPVTAIPLLVQVGIQFPDSVKTPVVCLPAFTPAQLKPLWAALEKRAVIIHNASYDYKLLKAHYGVNLRRVFDTQIAEQVLTTGDFSNKPEWLKHVALAATLARQLWVNLSKEARASFIGVVPDSTWRPTQSQVEYAALDVEHLHKLAEMQTAQLQEADLVRSFAVRMQALPALCDMELTGMLVDQRAWRTFLTDLQAQLHELEVELQTILTPYEWAHRKQKYAEEMAVREDYEYQKQCAEEGLESAWNDFLSEEDKAGKTWGSFKQERMALWRAQHPNPGVPHLDVESSINLGSPAQVRRAFTAIGLEVESTDKLSRQRLQLTDLSELQRRVVTLYGERSRLAKLNSAFGESVLRRIRPETGRLAAQVNIHLTSTSRMSMEKPNLQQIPREATLRHAFVADPHCLVVTADYKSQEIAVSAALSQDPTMMADVLAGRDLYKELAVQVFGVKLDEVTKEQRQQCKNALLGITYGLSAKGMVSRYFIPQRLAQRLLDGVRKRYPTFVAWSDKQVDLARTQEYVETPLGTKRYFRKAQEKAEWKMGTEPRNAPVQGTAADIVYRAVARLARVLPEGSYLGNVVHDEVVVVTPEEQAEEVAKLVEHEMQQAFVDILPFSQFGMRVGVDVHVAAHWEKG